MAGWFSRMVQAVSRSYERRVRRASQISEYGASHHHHDDLDDGGADIANVAPGTPARAATDEAPMLDTTLTPLAPPTPLPVPATALTASDDDDDDDGAVISNVAPGTPQRSAAASDDDDDDAVIVNL